MSTHEQYIKALDDYERALDAYDAKLQGEKTRGLVKRSDYVRGPRIVLRIWVISILLCLLPMSWEWKLLPGLIAFTCTICSGPILIMATGGCGCGHPACRVCRVEWLQE